MESNTGVGEVKSKGRAVIIVSVFTVLSILGGLIKLGGGSGSIALDSLPSFFVAGFFSPWPGAVVGVIGHLGSAATAGFPLGALHVPVGLMQGVWALVFGLVVRRIDRLWGLVAAGGLAIGLNGVVAPLLLIPLAPENADFYRSLIPILSVAAAANVVGACIGILVLSKLDLPRL